MWNIYNEQPQKGNRTTGYLTHFSERGPLRSELPLGGRFRAMVGSLGKILRRPIRSQNGEMGSQIRVQREQGTTYLRTVNTVIKSFMFTEFKARENVPSLLIRHLDEFKDRKCQDIYLPSIQSCRHLFTTYICQAWKILEKTDSQLNNHNRPCADVGMILTRPNLS